MCLVHPYALKILRIKATSMVHQGSLEPWKSSAYEQFSGKGLSKYLKHPWNIGKHFENIKKATEGNDSCSTQVGLSKVTKVVTSKLSSLIGMYTSLFFTNLNIALLFFKSQLRSPITEYLMESSR
jgi:hypothetical protein